MAERTDKEAEMGRKLVKGTGCSAGVAALLAMSFCERDMELIEHLRGMTELPAAEDFPGDAAIARALGMEEFKAAFTREKVQRFVYKRRMNGDFSADVARFVALPAVRAFEEKARGLRKGVTVFIGDSMMDTRHFSADASFAILVGGFLEGLGVGPYVNAGIGGNTTGQGLARYERDVLAHRPARVVLSFGSNDLANRVPMGKILENFDAMISAAQGKGAEVVMGLTLHVVPERLWWNREPMVGISRGEREALQREMEALSARHGVKCMNILGKLRAEHYCVDGIHLNQAGQEVCGVEALRCLCGGAE